MQATIAGNPCNINYWINRPLIFSDHARDKMDIIGENLIDTLPATSRLVDTDQSQGHIDAVTYKIVNEAEPEASFFLVLSPVGTVITAWRASKKEYQRWQVNKSRLRSKQAGGNPRTCTFFGRKDYAVASA